jgi:hypothetical protein
VNATKRVLPFWQILQFKNTCYLSIAVNHDDFTDGARLEQSRDSGQGNQA